MTLSCVFVSAWISCLTTTWATLVPAPCSTSETVSVRSVVPPGIWALTWICLAGPCGVWKATLCRPSSV